MKHLVWVLCPLFMVVFAFAVQAQSPRLARLKAEAEKGDPQSQYLYADELAWSGRAKEAMPWYEKAAASSNAYAIIALTVFKLRDIKPDSPEEKRLFAKLCPELETDIAKMRKDDSAEALYNLADLYSNGICVPGDDARAHELNLASAKKGNGRAQLRWRVNLGM